MSIQLLPEFSSNGAKNTDGLNLTNGFPSAQKPARQWFNWLFNAITKKTNELLTAYNAHVTQNQLEHNNLAVLIAAEAQARGNADNAEVDAREAAIEVVATRVEDLSVFKHVRSLYRDMSTSATPRPPSATDNYTVGSISAQLFPDSYVRQTIRLTTGARDTWIPVYLPIGCDVVLSVSGMVQSGGSGTGDDDIALRIKNFFNLGQVSFMNYRSTYVEIRVDRVSDDQTDPYTGDVTVYLEVATLTYLKPENLDNYPVISP